MNEQSIERLRTMRLSAMAEKLKELSSQPKSYSLPWNDLLSMLIDAEYDSRGSKRITSFLKKSRLKYGTAWERARVTSHVL